MIETSASRIYELVGAVKGFTFMDPAPTPEPEDIRRGITATFTMLGAKTRTKSVEVSVQFPADLPRVQALGAELDACYADRQPLDQNREDIRPALLVADSYLFQAIRLLEPRAEGDPVASSALSYIGEAHFHLSDVNGWLGFPALPIPTLSP